MSQHDICYGHRTRGRRLQKNPLAARDGRQERASHFGCVYGDFNGGGGGCLRGGGGLCVGLGVFLGSGGLRRGADVAGPDSGPVFGTVGFGCGFACGFDVERG